MKRTLSVMMTVLLVMISTLASPADKRFTVPIGASPSLGPENAPVTIIEFIDFQ